MQNTELIFEKSKPGLKATSLPEPGVPRQAGLPAELLRTEVELPEVPEVELIRHYTALSEKNLGVDNAFYPLGSCTMKYNPKINERLARLDGFTRAHPYLDAASVQGNLRLMYELEQTLCAITGMDAVTLQPAAGAHGELTGLMLIQAYLRERGEKRTRIIAPDSSHGTNPASAAMCGFETIVLKSNPPGTPGQGLVNIRELERIMDDSVAALMLTNPNTLGLFDESILRITELVHKRGGLVYGDGANANALLGQTLFKRMGFDIVHLNLHKTFSTPHGGGGPGAGPVAVVSALKDFLPAPVVEKAGESYRLSVPPKTIGRVKSFFGHFAVCVRAYSYIRALGREGLRGVSEQAVLNANYLKERLKEHFHLSYDTLCKHEFVLDDSDLPNGVTTMDIAKRLLDYGFHPPTVYFPLIVRGAIMVEPTESESRETLDRFADALIRIRQEAQEQPELVKTAPHTTPVSRLDEVLAARKPDLRHTKK